jgi:predicted nucleic acid-binding protein
MAIMVELGITDILTADQHFTHVGLGFRALPK